MMLLRPDWDQRNDVPIHYRNVGESFDHCASRGIEYVVSPAHSNHLPVRVLYVGSESRTLIVSFHGSLKRSKYELPRFEWRKSLSRFHAGRLFIADTTLELSPDVPLAWYIGTSRHNLVRSIAELVRGTANDGGYHRVILVGSSGGGFAAMAVSHQLSGSVAVAFSPQTSVRNYVPWVRDAFVKHAFPGYESFEEVETSAPERVNLQRLYGSKSMRNAIYYVQNSNDKTHFMSHYTPFAMLRGIDPSAGGVDSSGSVRMVLEEMHDGHHPPTRKRFIHHISSGYSHFFGDTLELESVDLPTRK